MDRHRPHSLLDRHRDELIRNFLIEGWTQKKLKENFEQTHGDNEPRLSIQQWKSELGKLGIFKNLNDNEVAYIRAEISRSPPRGPWDHLILASDLLQHIGDLDNHEKRKGSQVQAKPYLDRRDIKVLSLSFDFKHLSDPQVFKTFQRLLFETRIYFHKSFDDGTWAPDDKGLYGCTSDLRERLKQLSGLHNLVVRALKEFKRGETNEGWALIRRSFTMHEAVVNNPHHRQFPDLLAVLVLLRKNNWEDIRQRMQKHLCHLATRDLQRNDPRIKMFKCLGELSLDAASDAYVAFDTYCRDLWSSRIGHGFKAYYSYNQASFPRTGPGEFYSLYKGRFVPDILQILHQVDAELGESEHETFCLWHTAIEYFWGQDRFQEMILITETFCQRLDSMRGDNRLFEQAQLNNDVSHTYYLLGQAQEAVGDLPAAWMSFLESLELRSRIILNDCWDAPKAIALEKAISIGTQLGYPLMAQACREMLIRMRASVVREDRAECAMTNGA